MYGIVINEKGFISVGVIRILEDGSLDCYELEEGESVIEIDCSAGNVTCKMNKPQWDFDTGEWVDTNPLPPVESKPEEPSLDNKMEVLEKQLKQQEEAIGLIATQVARNTLLQNGGIMA